MPIWWTTCKIRRTTKCVRTSFWLENLLMKLIWIWNDNTGTLMKILKLGLFWGLSLLMSFLKLSYIINMIFPRSPPITPLPTNQLAEQTEIVNKLLVISTNPLVRWLVQKLRGRRRVCKVLKKQNGRQMVLVLSNRRLTGWCALRT